MTKPGSVDTQNRIEYGKLLVFLVLIIFSGLSLTISSPPFDLGFLAWFSLAPFLYVLRQRKIPAAGFGFLFGAVLGLGTCYWIYNLEHVSPAGFFFWQLGFSLYFMLFGILYRILFRNIGSWIILGAPALWVALEYTRANLFFLSCPWTLLGHSQYQYIPVIQIANITGVYGISFILVMVNQVISEALEYYIIRKITSVQTHIRVDRTVDRHKIIVTFVTVFILVFYSLFKLAPNAEIQETVRVAIVQGNVLVDNGMSFDEQKAHLEVYKGLTAKAAQQKTDLIVWPATSLPGPPQTNRLVGYTVREIAQLSGTYLLVGGAGYEKVAPRKERHNPFSNSEYLIRPIGGLAGQYNKMHLLAFNEYVPLQGIIKWPSWITTLHESFLSGNEYKVFQVANGRFGTPICSENLFSDHFRRFVKKGAQFMVSVSNEGFLQHTVAPYQTLAMNVFRAVENRVSVARATTTGISAFISKNGEILDTIHDENNNEISVAGILVRDIPLSDKKTFYTRFGDVFSFIAIGLTVFFVAVSLMRKENASGNV